MCNFGGGGSSNTSTTPAYIPPAQTATTGGGAAAPGVQVKGQSSRYEARSTRNMSARTRGGSSGQVDSTTSPKRRRSASLGL